LAEVGPATLALDQPGGGPSAGVILIEAGCVAVAVPGRFQFAEVALGGAQVVEGHGHIGAVDLGPLLRQRAVEPQRLAVAVPGRLQAAEILEPARPHEPKEPACRVVPEPVCNPVSPLGGRKAGREQALLAVHGSLPGQFA
jgi:hypothetical protein